LIFKETSSILDDSNTVLDEPDWVVEELEGSEELTGANRRAAAVRNDPSGTLGILDGNSAFPQIAESTRSAW
jgi:hypothetical protein